MAYRRKKGGQRLIEMARAGSKRRRAAVKERKEQKRLATSRANRLISGASPKSTIRRGKTTITYKPKPSPQLRPKPKSIAVKTVVTPPKGVKAATPGAGLTKRLTTIREKARKRPLTKTEINEQRRKNLRSEIEGRMKPDDVGRLAKLYGKVMGKEMTHRDEAALAGHMATEGLGLMVGGPLIKGGFKAGKVAYGAAKPVGKAALKAGKKVAVKAVKAGTKAVKSARTKVVKTGKAVGRAARTGVTKVKTGVRTVKGLARKADAALLRLQKLTRGKGGKLVKPPKKTPKKAPVKKKPTKKPSTEVGYAQHEINRRAASRAAARRRGK
jgi:hypothetical protein